MSSFHNLKTCLYKYLYKSLFFTSCEINYINNAIYCTICLLKIKILLYMEYILYIYYLSIVRIMYLV